MPAAAKTPDETTGPRVRLVNAFDRPFDNAVATARTCYSSRVIETAEVGRDEKARALRDRIASSTYDAGHHTTLQHAHFQFVLEGVSRQLIWSFLHAHPFYNSEQVSQRYVAVAPGHFHVPAGLAEADEALYRRTVEAMHQGYRDLCELLRPAVEEAWYGIFPARRRQPERWDGALKKKAQEIARYVLPVATHAHLYHTVSGLTLHRLHRLCGMWDVPEEARRVVGAMVDAVRAHDPLFFRDVEDPLPLEDTYEAQLVAELSGGEPGRHARAFRDEFDASLGGRRSRLVGFSAQAEQNVAQAVRSVLGLPASVLPDAEAIERVLSPAKNPLLAEKLNLTTVAKVTRALHHAQYTFRRRISHTADSQDQRHRMVPGSRPVLAAQYVGGEPDVVVPDLVAAVPEAYERFMALSAVVFGAVDALLDAGVPAEKALYLLPNAFPIRFEESGDLLNLHHKWTTRLCYNAQEEIWRASLDEVEQVREVHPALGRHLLPPCGLRSEAGRTPYCPEGPRYCGVPVWKLPLEDWERVL